MRQVAVDAWVEHSGMLNPGGQYAAGRAARRVLDDARELIASLLDADPVEVIFTGSGTEADNLAVTGLYRASDATRVVASPLEHSAVLKSVQALGADVEWLPVADGRVSDLTALESPAALATCMWANNETGAIQPVAEIVERAAAAGTPVHVDAVQVVGHLPVSFRELGATTLAASAHKFGGPRSGGLLLARRSPAPTPILFGGGQERAIRPGTLDVATAAATAAALEEAVGEMAAEEARLTALRDRLRAGILSRVEDVVVHTTEPALPELVHLCIPGADGISLMVLLDAAGIEAATGSTCAAGVNRVSHILEAMGVPERVARGAVRFTVGRTSTEEDVDAVLAVIADTVERARLAGMAG